MKQGTKTPKHGLIYSHVFISRSPKPVRGRISRMLAARMSLAARIDAFEGTPWGEEELRKIHEEREKQKKLDEEKDSSDKEEKDSSDEDEKISSDENQDTEKKES